jgi:DNA-binding MarR family transcriptional regulator
MSGPSQQHWCDVGASDLDSKLVAAMERVGQALRVRQGVVARNEGLTPLQLRLVLFLSKRPAAGRTVGLAANDLDLTRATVSDAVNTLANKGLLSKQASPSDRRVVHLHLTQMGKELASRQESWHEVFESAASQFPRATREAVFLFLARLIESLHSDGVLSVARMCLTCQHLEERGGSNGKAPYYCGLLGEEKGPAGLKIDCATHVPTVAESQ